MSLVEDLNQCQEFLLAMTMEDFYLQAIRPCELEEAPLSQGFRQFLKRVVIIVEKKDFPSKEEFILHYQTWFKKQSQKATLREVLESHVQKVEKEDRLEVKGLQENPLVKINFNVSIQIFLSDDFHSLFERLGSQVFGRLLLEVTLLMKEDKFYIQLNNKTLLQFLDKKKLESKPK